MIFSSFWNPFLQTHQAKHQPITFICYHFYRDQVVEHARLFFLFFLPPYRSTIWSPKSELVLHYRNRSKQTEIWRPCVGDTNKLNRSKKPNGVSLLQCAEDVADLAVDLGQLLVDRRQIHALVPSLRVRTTAPATEKTPRGKAKSERKEGSGSPRPLDLDSSSSLPNPTTAGSKEPQPQCGSGWICRARIERAGWRLAAAAAAGVSGRSERRHAAP